MNKSGLAPIKFAPYYKTVLWGGNRIASYKRQNLKLKDIGESWEISGLEGRESVVESGEYKGLNLRQLIDMFKSDLVGKHIYEKYGNDFPLLVKIIDAHATLSLQVHPGDKLAKARHNCLGKTEMWYVIDAESDAKIYSGLKHDISVDDYERMIADDSIMDVVACHDSHPGDLFFLPAGCIHAIGAGNLLVEIHESSDITYRLSDFGRLDSNGNPRELHTELAKDAINYKAGNSDATDYDREKRGETELLSCKYFKTGRVICDGNITLDCNEDSFMIVMCVDGSASLNCSNGTTAKISRGSTLLIPAVVDSLEIVGNATLLTVTA